MIKIDLEQLYGSCSCGSYHQIDVKEIILKENALKMLPEIIERYGWKQIALICDSNTYLAAGKEICQSITVEGTVILPADFLHADEHGVESARKEIPKRYDVLFAVGSGTIHDITRFLAYESGKPFVSIPTAASVDGFVSTVAAMTWNGFKKSFTAVSPICVIADTNIYAKAPMRLTASGVADLLGKYTALTDWKIGHLLTGEPFCEKIYQMETEALEKVKQSLYGLNKGDQEAYEDLMYGLLISGLAMQMVGNSRPASGSEHHLSHIWEMELLNPYIPAYHGEKVGVGMCLVSEIYEQDIKKLESGDYVNCCSTEKLEGIFPDLSKRTILDEMLEENTPDPLEQIDPEQLRKHEKTILSYMKEVPGRKEIVEMLQTVGAPVTLSDIGLEDSIKEDSIRLSPYVRKRLTWMRLRKCYQFIR